MSTVTDFRKSLQATLQTALDVRFIGGRVDSAQLKALGCVWLEGKRPQPRDGNNEEIVYGIRLFRAWIEPQAGAFEGRNVEALEQDLETLQVTLKQVLTSAGHSFFNVAAVSIDYERQYVQAELVGFQRNLSSGGG